MFRGSSMNRKWFISGLFFTAIALCAEDDHVKQEAFKKLSESISPLTSEQVKKVRRLWNESQRLKTYTGSAPPRPSNALRVVDLGVGALPTVVRLGAGYVSVVYFFDANGKPWPIRGYNIGNPGIVNVIWNQSTPEEDQSGAGLSNTLMMQAQSLYKPTNMVVLLRGMSTPVLLEVIPGQSEIDYRLDLQVPKSGPFTDEAGSMPTTVEPVMMDFVNNVAPNNSTQLQVRGGTAQAWSYNGKIYLRTPLTVISPAWISKVVGPNGDVQVYEMANVSVVLALSNGKTVQLSIG